MYQKIKRKKAKPVLLAVDTSGRTGSVAVGTGDKSLAEVTFSAPMRHSAELFPSVEKVLDQIGKKISDIGQISIAVGPGSFTGIRIAVTMAKMMALGSNIKILAANTMDVIALNANDYIQESKTQISRIGTILDAKRKQFYVSVYEVDDGDWVKTDTARLMKADEFVQQFGKNKEPIWLLGEGLVYYKDQFKAEKIRVLDEKYWPARARNVYLLAKKMIKARQFTDPADLVPLYLRQPEAIENWNKASGMA